MKLGVLGPLHVEDSTGGFCSPRGLKVRVLLANLLIEYDRAVSTEHLIEELWRSAPPKSAKNALQVYVSGLRRLLRGALPSEDIARIVTHPGGYLLEVDKQEFDLPRFEYGVRDARLAEERGDLERASRLLSDALALWRGPALFDVCVTVALEAESRRLNEMRIAAQERRLRIDLRLGRSSDLISELQSLIARNPLREKLYEYLMIALHEQGRPAEALQAYKVLRRDLRNNLGLEPGPGVRELQRTVLNREPLVLAQVL